MACLVAIETDLGRDRAPRAGPRSIDVDLLLYGSLVMSTGDVTVPHPRMAARAFVLVPLAELAPALRHPVSGRAFSRLLASLDVGGVTPWSAS